MKFHKIRHIQQCHCVQFASLVMNGSHFTGAMAYLGLYNPKVEPNQRISFIVVLI